MQLLEVEGLEIVFLLREFREGENCIFEAVRFRTPVYRCLAVGCREPWVVLAPTRDDIEGDRRREVLTR